MHGESLKELQSKTIAERASLAVGFGISQYVNVCLLPNDYDAIVPNYTSPRDLSLAVRSDEHCEFKKDQKSSILIGLMPNTNARKQDEMAEDVVDYIIDNTDFMDLRPDHQFVSLLQIHRAIDIIKRANYGSDSPALKANMLSYKITGRLIELMPTDDASGALYSSVDTAIDLMREEDPWYDWLHVKSKTMFTSLRTIWAVEKEIPEVNKLIDTKEVSVQTKQNIDDLFQKALEPRHYGIKLCTAESLMGGSYIFHDSLTAQAQADKGLGHAPSAKYRTVYAMLAAEVSTENYFEELKGTDGPKILSNGAVSNLFKSNVGTKYGILLGNDGELYVDPECSIPLRTIYEMNNADTAYELLRAELVANFADLVMPAELVKGTGLKLPRFDRSTPVDDIIAQLVLPRRRYINDASEKDILNAVKNENNGSPVRIHGVTYHKRKLLPNQRASARAKSLAAEVEYYLPDGYTFVKEHVRGDADARVVGHKIVKR